MHKPSENRGPASHTDVPSPDDTWGIDIILASNFRPPQNDVGLKMRKAPAKKPALPLAPPRPGVSDYMRFGILQKGSKRLLEASAPFYEISRVHALFLSHPSQVPPLAVVPVSSAGHRAETSDGSTLRVSEEPTKERSAAATAWGTEELWSCGVCPSEAAVEAWGSASKLSFVRVFVLEKQTPVAHTVNPQATKATA